MLTILLKSLVIGALAGAAVSAGAARMFHAPEIQAMGAFRTLGELNACKGDPVAHFSFGLGFYFSSAASVVGCGGVTQDVAHRIVPNWAAGLLLLKNKKVEETLYDPAKMMLVGTVVGAVVYSSLTLLASAVPEKLSTIAAGVLTPAANNMVNLVMPILFWLGALDAGKITGVWGTILGGLTQLIMGNAVPGLVLGIICGKSIEEHGFTKMVKIMIAVIVALLLVIGQARGFWAKALAALSGFGL
ncbi:MAG: DUF4311 domain-containing protein [Erysipelotrichaceae bacterium]|nr:DUF4311 domain-containing protein [Erysipelotrichaceae bacterium]MBQ6494348.1 DUF4311 domain-containing protein [Erysipelotrichaceae bacterium]